NGNIYTVDENFSKAQAIAVKGQYIIGVGSNENVKKFVGESTNVASVFRRLLLHFGTDYRRIVDFLGIMCYNQSKVSLNTGRRLANREFNLS
ncbi:MAG: hypothetical protein ACOX8T_10285, partial [Bacillota bacterium]